MYNYTCPHNMYFDICTCTPYLNYLLHVLRSQHFLAVNCIIKHFLKHNIPITCSSSTVIIISYHLADDSAQTTCGGSRNAHHFCTCISCTVLQNFAEYIFITKINLEYVASISRTVLYILFIYCIIHLFGSRNTSKNNLKNNKEECIYNFIHMNICGFCTGYLYN